MPEPDPYGPPREPWYIQAGGCLLALIGVVIFLFLVFRFGVFALL